jgi:hypothetical protein
MPRSGLLISAALVLMAATATGQDFGVELTIRFPEETTSFQTGEIIPIEISFRASIPETYQIETRTYDRSGRLGVEQFHVNPGGRDPLHDLYKGCLYGGFVGGGISGGPKWLTGWPEIIRADLNEWVALDKPGLYSLYVTSRRVSRWADGRKETLELRSNTIDFEIVEADAVWQEATVASAAAVLGNPSSTKEERTTARRALRFLDSPASVHEIVQQLARSLDDRNWDFNAGLIGSRNRQLVLQELESQWGEPEAGVTVDFLWVLAIVKFLQTAEPFPPYPENNPAQQEAWQAHCAARINRFNDLQEGLYEQATLLVGVKKGSARVQTMRTLLLRPAKNQADMGPLADIPDADLASAFLDLTADQQHALLSTSWLRLKLQAMSPVLEDLLDRPTINHRLRDIAFQRLYELEPDKAIPRIFEEIRQPHVDAGMSTVKAKTLAVLSDAVLPQFDVILLRRLTDPNSRTRVLDAGLIGRYATEAIRLPVKSYYESVSGPWAGDIADGFMTYFLRVDPDYGVKQMQKRAGTKTIEALKKLRNLDRWADVEPFVIARLNEPELWAARDAAELLGKFGGPKAKTAMLERLRRFHEEWIGREEDLRWQPNMPSEVGDAVSFQLGLVKALGRARNWLLSDDEVGELEKFTVGQQRENVARFRWQSPLRLSVTILFDGRMQASIGGDLFFTSELDDLRGKLSQFPGGTAFRLATHGPPDQMEEVVRSIKEVAASHGLRIEDVTK